MPLGLARVEPCALGQRLEVRGDQPFARAHVAAQLHFDQLRREHVHAHGAVGLDPLRRNLHRGEETHAAQDRGGAVAHLAQRRDWLFGAGEPAPGRIEQLGRHPGQAGEFDRGERHPRVGERRIGQRARAALDIAFDRQPRTVAERGLATDCQVLARRRFGQALRLRRARQRKRTADHQHDGQVSRVPSRRTRD